MKKTPAVPDTVTLLTKELNKVIQRLKKEEAKLPKIKANFKKAELAETAATKLAEKTNSALWKAEDAAGVAEEALYSLEGSIESSKEDIFTYKAQIKEAGKKK
jgi:peptidoglycan hydrolase CwlO-like protein